MRGEFPAHGPRPQVLPFAAGRRLTRGGAGACQCIARPSDLRRAGDADDGLGVRYRIVVPAPVVRESGFAPLATCVRPVLNSGQ